MHQISAPEKRGWVSYYGAFYRSGLRFLAWRINGHLARWAMHKFKRFRGKYAKAMAWLPPPTHPAGVSPRDAQSGAEVDILHVGA